MPTPVGYLQAVLEAIGEQDTELGGLYSTQLSAPTIVGQTFISVGNVAQWPTTGSFIIDGQLYRYTGRTTNSLTGITHRLGGVDIAGIRVVHDVDSEVLDVSKNRSALDLLRRSFFVATAEGEDLNVIARNLGVPRAPFVANDDQFRRIIQALAYNPRGTVFGLELALEALAGAGNFEIIEDLNQFNNTVFIQVAASLILTEGFAGETYLTQNEIVGDSGLASNEIGPISTTNAIQVNNVRLADDEFTIRADSNFLFSQQAVPDVDGVIEIPFAFVGTDEAAQTLFANGGRLFNTLGGTASAFLEAENRRMLFRSDVSFEVDLRLDPVEIATWPTQGVTTTPIFTIDLVSQAWRQRVIVRRSNTADSLDFWLVDGSGSEFFVGTVTATTAREVTLLLRRTEQEQELRILGETSLVVADTGQFTNPVPADAFKIRVGLTDASATEIQQTVIGFGFGVDNRREVVSLARTGTTAQAGTPTVTTIFTLDSTDVGRNMELSGFTVQNAQGGNNNGIYEIVSVVGNDVTLQGFNRTEQASVPAIGNRIQIDDGTFPFRFPQDLGQILQVTDSELGNNLNSQIVSIIDPVTGLPYVAGQTGEGSAVDLLDAFVAPEVQLSVQLVPDFVADTGLGSVNTLEIDLNVLRLRPPLAVQGLVGNLLDRRKYEAGYTVVLSAQIQEDADTEIVAVTTDPLVLSGYAIYANDPLGLVRVYTDELTAAGVIAELLVD